MQLGGNFSYEPEHMVSEHTVEGAGEETDYGGGGGGGGEGGGEYTAAGKSFCRCNLSRETQDLLKEVFKDIVSRVN